MPKSLADLVELSESRRHDVVCIGSALVDHLSLAETSVVEELGLAPGSMTLVDGEQADRIALRLGAGRSVSGGTTANTAVGIASLGGSPAFVGAVAHDSLGSHYEFDLEQSGVRPLLQRVDGGGTGRCYVAVTADSERTMATCLGVSGALGIDAISEQLFGETRLVYFDGYLLDFDRADELSAQMVALAANTNTALALGLADSFVVDRHRSRLEGLLDHVDVIFANEAEACALSGMSDPVDALDALSRRVPLLVVTLGANGALVGGSEGVVSVPAEPYGEVVDVTGAGDLFAAGVCFGLTHGLDLERTARLGAVCAGEVIAHLGGRPELSLVDVAERAEISLM